MIRNILEMMLLESFHAVDLCMLLVFMSILSFRYDHQFLILVVINTTFTILCSIQFRTWIFLCFTTS